MIGRIEKGFDLRGYHFSRQPLRLAGMTAEKFLERIHRLYDRQPGTKEGDVSGSVSISPPLAALG